MQNVVTEIPEHGELLILERPVVWDNPGLLILRRGHLKRVDYADNPTAGQVVPGVEPVLAGQRFTHSLTPEQGTKVRTGFLMFKDGKTPLSEVEGIARAHGMRSMILPEARSVLRAGPELDMCMVLEWFFQMAWATGVTKGDGLFDNGIFELPVTNSKVVAGAGFDWRPALRYAGRVGEMFLKPMKDSLPVGKRIFPCVDLD